MCRTDTVNQCSVGLCLFILCLNLSCGIFKKLFCHQMGFGCEFQRQENLLAEILNSLSSLLRGGEGYGRVLSPQTDISFYPALPRFFCSGIFAQRKRMQYTCNTTPDSQQFPLLLALALIFCGLRPTIIPNFALFTLNYSLCSTSFIELLNHFC